MPFHRVLIEDLDTAVPRIEKTERVVSVARDGAVFVIFTEKKRASREKRA